MNYIYKFLSYLIIIFIYHFATAQLININPDPNGTPWIAGGFKVPSEYEMTFIRNIPELKPSNNYKFKTLPSWTDNSANMYFRPVISQIGGSCAQVSGIGYNFTYELCFRRNLPANSTLNQYPPHYTFNFLNDGNNNNGSSYFSGWDIIKSSGCPNVADYGTVTSPNIRWMNGYQKYYNGMQNKITDYFKIYVGNPEGLNLLKNYLHNHLEGASVGGLVNFSAGVSSYTIRALPPNTHQGGLAVIIKFGTEVDHAMTFVGYDDSIRYDFNNDGKYTNNTDINGDGIVDMKDWEIGGLLIANSWGTSWGFQGKCYMMYKLLAEPVYNGGIWENTVYGIHVRKEYTPLLACKIVLKHNSRKQIRITAGSSPDVNATQASYLLSFPLFKNQGGDFYMQGGTTDDDKTLEFGLDITPLLSNLQNNQPSKFFLYVDEDDPNGSGQG